LCFYFSIYTGVAPFCDSGGLGNLEVFFPLEGGFQRFPPPMDFAFRLLVLPPMVPKPLFSLFFFPVVVFFLLRDSISPPCLVFLCPRAYPPFPMPTGRKFFWPPGSFSFFMTSVTSCPFPTPPVVIICISFGVSFHTCTSSVFISVLCETHRNQQSPSGNRYRFVFSFRVQIRFIRCFWFIFAVDLFFFCAVPPLFLLRTFFPTIFEPQGLKPDERPSFFFSHDCPETICGFFPPRLSLVFSCNCNPCRGVFFPPPLRAKSVPDSVPPPLNCALAFVLVPFVPAETNSAF